MSIVTFDFKNLSKNLEKNFNSQGIYQLFETVERIKEKSYQEYIAEIFEQLDNKIFLKERDKVNFIVHSKKKRSIETIFGDITFYRRYYFNQKTKKYQFLLDSKLDIDKLERIHKQVKLLVLENFSGSMSYKDLIKTLKNANISVMSVSNILNKSDKSDLSDFLTSIHIPKIPLVNNVIYLQADDTFVSYRSKIKKWKKLKTGRLVKSRKWKPIRVVTIHTGYAREKHPKAKPKLTNKRIFTFKIKDWSWEKIFELCKKFYQINDNTKIYICGDGASWIKNGADELGGKFVMDTFHVIREYSRILNHKNNINHENILKLAKKYYSNGEFLQLYQLTIDLKSKVELHHKNKKITKLINYLNKNKNGIEIYSDPNILGVSIEGDIFNYIKRYLGKRKSFNIQVIETILNIKTAIKNKINILKYLKHELKEKNLLKIKEIINLKWKYQTIPDPPILNGEFSGDKNRYFYKVYLNLFK